MNLRITNTFDGLSPFDRRYWETLNEMATRLLNAERLGRGQGHEKQPSKEVLPVLLTANLGGGAYSYTEQEPAANGAWAGKAGGAHYNDAGTNFARSGTCHEDNLNDQVPVPSYQNARVKYDSTGTPYYRFNYCCRTFSGSGSGSGSGGRVSTGTSWTDNEKTYGCIPVGDCICMFETVITRTFEINPDFTVTTTVGQATFRTLTGCCWLPCEPPASGSAQWPSGSAGDYPNLDIWRPCTEPSESATPIAGDLLFPPQILTYAPDEFADPIIRVDVGTCYRYVGSVTNAGEGDTFSSIGYYEFCTDDGCGGLDPCNSQCQQTPTNNPTADLTGQGCPSTQPNDTAFNPTSFNATGGPGSTPLWLWTGTVNAALLRIYCDGTTMYARLSNALGNAHFGAVGGPNGGYKNVTASVTCGEDGNLQGTFTLNNTANFCDGGDIGTRSIVITL